MSPIQIILLRMFPLIAAFATANIPMNDVFNDEQIAFLNCLDKGYLECMRHGKQMTLQPNFVKSGKKFTATQALSSSSVASYRSGNER